MSGNRFSLIAFDEEEAQGVAVDTFAPATSFGSKTSVGANKKKQAIPELPGNTSLEKVSNALRMRKAAEEEEKTRKAAAEAEAKRKAEGKHKPRSSAHSLTLSL